MRNFFSKRSNFRNFDSSSLRFFSEIVKQESSKSVSSTKSASSIIAEYQKREFKLTPQQISEIEKVGADLFLTHESKQTFLKTGLRFEDVNTDLNQYNLKTSTGLRLTYLKNQLLLQDYDTVLREFFQATAQLNSKGLKLNFDLLILQNLIKMFHTLNSRRSFNENVALLLHIN